MRYILSVFIIVGLVACAESEHLSDGFDSAVAGYERHDGFFDIFVNASAGKVMALLPAPAEDGTSLRSIHAMRLAAGLGSNPIGLDRGWGNSGVIIRFREIGGKVFAEVENHRYRASADNPLEQQAVSQSFARSLIWSAPVEAVSPDGELLIDISSLLTKDLLGLADAMAEDGAGFSLSPDLSVPAAGAALAFPDNVELEAHLTFTSSTPGPEVDATAAWANAVTLTVHHSFVRLPDDGYRPRTADPRVGTFSLDFYDYSAPLDGQVLQSYAIRHRLQHEELGNPDSPIIEPIVFYVDRGAPEQIREALIDGISWWSEAFEAAGFAGGFRVEVLPEGAHPLDIRYNVVQWVHRQTRGWSYGGGVIDPRTGEYIKGHVILGSQRVRQDRMIFEGLAGTAKTGSGSIDDPIELSLDRIRQLAAHEVTHALGFGHNFAASATGRSSVADYPAPWVIARPDGSLDFSVAYDKGIGNWDIAAVKWLYGEYDPVTEQQDLDIVVAEAREAGLLFIADQDGRSPGTAHPEAAVWDNGSDPVSELQNVMDVRRIALANFDETRIAEGRPLSALREVITPIYLYHRYQVNAAAKSIGGMSYQYGKRGEDEAEIVPVPLAEQNRAIDVLIATLSVDEFILPPSVLELMVPGSQSYDFRVQSETLSSRSRPIFDMTSAIETSADLTFSALFHPARVERIVQSHAQNLAPSLEEIMNGVEKKIFATEETGPMGGEVARTIRGRYVFTLIDLEKGPSSQNVKAKVRARLIQLEQRFLKNMGARPEEKSHRLWLADQINAHLSRPVPELALPAKGPKTPPGSPIGGSMGAYETCWHCEE